MPEIIHQLSEHVANQIAAGEVIQRPASAVKELMENAVDSGARRVEVRVTEAGRTAIQVLDDGCGMVPADARRCFDRHATSKITSAEDLFSIMTKGFRGEALASIASIAHVELRTRHASEEWGTQVQLVGGTCEEEGPCAMEVGTAVSVRNLFFNVPARRQFLKSDAVELRHVLDEFHRVALAHETIHFVLFHNDTELFNLKPGTVRQRVVGVFGAKYDERLVPVEEATDVVQVKGFVGKPAFARRSRGEQFLFVNQRFVRHHVLNRVIMEAFSGLLPPGHFPLYVLFLDIDPARLDVNIHPTKTEVKFEEDRSVQALLLPAIRRGLGRYAVAPSLDFDQESSLQILPIQSDQQLREPQVSVNSDYNPFRVHPHGQGNSVLRPSSGQIDAWKDLYNQESKFSGRPDVNGVQDSGTTDMEKRGGLNDAASVRDISLQRSVFQLQNRFIVTSTQSGILVVDQNRAHQRVLYEALVTRLNDGQAPISSQQLLFPEAVSVTQANRVFLLESGSWLAQFGLQIESCDSGIQVTGMPAEGEASPHDLIDAALLEQEEGGDGVSRAERVAANMAKVLAVKPGRNMGTDEMMDLVDRLFACSEPALDPFGRKVLATFGVHDIEQRFQ